MEINKLPQEILEKILFEGDYFIISKVCQKWHEIAEKNKFKFNGIVFDLYKDDPEEIKKNSLDVLYVYRSQCYDKNGILILKIFKNEYDNFKQLLNRLTFINILNIIYDPLHYVKTNKENKEILILNKNIFSADLVGEMTLYFLYQILKDFSDKSKIKILNIKIKNYINRIEEIQEKNIFDHELNIFYTILDIHFFKFFEEFTFKVLDNIYIIYKKTKKTLIIRYGDYQQYNFIRYLFNVCSLCNKNDFFKNHIVDNSHNCINYEIECFIDMKNFFRENDYYCYPANLISFRYDFFLKETYIDKIIVISDEFLEFKFDNLLKNSRHFRTKTIEYYCLDKYKTEKYSHLNFKFKPVPKEKIKDYSFTQLCSKF